MLQPVTVLSTSKVMTRIRGDQFACESVTHQSPWAKFNAHPRPLSCREWTMSDSKLEREPSELGLSQVVTLEKQRSDRDLG